MLGAIFALCSALFITTKDTISKRVASIVHSTTSTCASFVYAFPWYGLLLTILWFIGIEDFRIGVGFLLLVTLRAITDSAAEWSKMTALATGDLSIVTLFFSLSPAILLLASPVITGDVLTKDDVIGVLIVALGCAVAAYRPGMQISGAQLKPIALALVAAFFFALNSCLDRLAVQQSSAALSGFAMTALSGLFFLPRVLLNQKMRSELLVNWRPFSLRGLLEVAFMVLKLLALQHLPAPQAVALQRVSIPLSVISGRVFFREHHTIQRLVGALIILGGVVLAI